MRPFVEDVSILELRSVEFSFHKGFRRYEFGMCLESVWYEIARISKKLVVGLWQSDRSEHLRQELQEQKTL